MDSGRKKVLMACCNYWDSPFQVGSHHLAKGFAESGWDVAFVSDPISPLHWVGPRSTELNDRFAIYHSGGQRRIGGNVWTYVPGAVLTPHNKPILSSVMVQKYWHRLTYPDVIEKIRLAGFSSVDLIYFDSISQAFWLNAVKHKKSVLRIADNNHGFGKFTSSLRWMEQWLAERVDLVVYTAKGLEEYVDNLNPQGKMYFPNGVNYRHFSEGNRSVPDEYLSISRPIAVYVGALDVWFDYDLVNNAARQLPHISFVLIGPEGIARTKLEKLPNIHLLGKRAYDELPGYLINADVGIIPFNVKKYPDLVNCINPLKLYEYMSCGLPVVATKWDELISLSSPAILVQQEEEFINAVRNCTSLAYDPIPLHDYAAKQDWSKRIIQLENWINVKT